MSTVTQTYTVTDIRTIFAMFQADLEMLALRTQAMPSDHAAKYAHDICLMAVAQCLVRVHVQLRDAHGNLVKVHRYSLQEGRVSDSQRPGGNRWPCLPDGTLSVIIEYSDDQRLEDLKRSGQLEMNWGPSYWSTNYSGMRSDGARLYSSNGYGLQRDSFAN